MSSAKNAETHRKNPSRRRFLVAATATVAGAVLSYYGLSTANEASYNSVRRDYSGALAVTQSVDVPTEIRYPGLLPTDLHFVLSLENKSDITLESVVVEQAGLDGFEFLKSVGATTAPSNIDHGLQFGLGDLQAWRTHELSLTYRTGWDSKTSNVKADAGAVARYSDQGGFLPSFMDPYEGAHSQDVTSDSQTVTVTVSPDPTALRELHDQGREDRLNEIRDKRLLLQYPLKNESARDSYWKDPSSENGRGVFEAFCSEFVDAREPYGQMAEELTKLPDLQHATYDDRLAEAVESIACDSLLFEDQTTIKSRITAMLDEGLPDKRKYCTPLQALLWYYEDFGDTTYRPLKSPGFDVRAVASIVWEKSPTFNYKTDYWKDFDTVIDRLNSLPMIDVYMGDNIRYQDYVDLKYSPPEVFGRKLANCADSARFGAYALIRNGYQAYVFSAKYARDKGHAVTLLVEPKTNLYFLFDNWQSQSERIQGPFSSYRQAADHVTLRKPWISYSLWDINGKRIFEVFR